MNKSVRSRINLGMLLKLSTGIFLRKLRGKSGAMPMGGGKSDEIDQAPEQAPAVITPSVDPPVLQSDSQLCEKIRQVVHEQQLWKDADLSIAKLSKAVYSNKSYVTRCFREQMHTTFSDYINRCRIDYVVEQLRLDPNQSLEHLFFDAGYHFYSTAWRNFTRYMGVSPSEYVSRLSNTPIKL